MITSLKSIEIFETLKDEELEKAKIESSSLTDIIRAIDESEFWALKFYELPIEDRRIAFLYALEISLNRKRTLVKQFEGAKSAKEIYENIFSVPLKPWSDTDAVLFEDHIHFLIDEDLKRKFDLDRVEGRLISLLIDSERFTEYGRQFAGTVSVVDKNYPDLEEAAYHERYHGLTHRMPLSQTADVVARYWNNLNKRSKLERTKRNVFDFLIMKRISAHLEVNAIYYASNGLDEEKLFSGYWTPTLFRALGIFFPEYINRTIKGGPPGKLLGECLKAYRTPADILRRIGTEENDKVQLYLELLMYNELEQLPNLVSQGI